MDTTEVVFGPTGIPSGRLLTFVLTPCVGMWAYFGSCIPECGTKNADSEFLLFGAVMAGLGLVAWNWRPIRAHIVLASEGIMVHPVGTAFVPRRIFTWDRVESFAHVPGPPKSTSFFRVTVRPGEGQTKSKNYSLALQGMGTKPQKILVAAQPFLEAAGFQARGKPAEGLFSPSVVEVTPIKHQGDQ
ncbi:MAG: hypothetical protein AAF718_13770 [Pseudomonadota bacterium]